MTKKGAMPRCGFNVDEEKCLKVQVALGILNPSCEPETGRCFDVRWEITQYELTIEREKLGFVEASDD